MQGQSMVFHEVAKPRIRMRTDPWLNHIWRWISARTIEAIWRPLHSALLSVYV